ncbi:GntR family transcriptional regulator [Rhizobium sp. L80/93]|uniref:GntR family transcriptional regulator n=1 Tax=Rhizobium sp. E27B/91 TaxID=2819995 RepID=UPI001ADD0EFA|nr:GntR family transcriptional regulator [Rhizobium sp. E27B/91]MBO9186938.1 GntR family transcriptional regulator [Rhizobium sp. E27B/91]
MREPIDKKSLQDNTVDWLRDAIVRGEFLPGATLTEQGLAQQVGVGRGTVRSALFALEEKELVMRTPYSSWHVAHLDAREISEIYSMRAAFEGLAARIVSERWCAIDTTRITEAFDNLGGAEDGGTDARLEADLGFHASIVEAANHRLLMRRHAQLADKMEWLYRWSELHWPRRRPLVAEHQRLFETLMQENPEDAEKAVRDHIADSIADDIAGFHELQRSNTQKQKVYHG